MSTERRLARLCRLGEDSTVAFLGATTMRPGSEGLDGHALARLVVALANTRGGRILVGVEHDGHPSGTGDAAQTERVMAAIVQACQQSVRPALLCPIHRHRLDERTVLEVEVPAFSPARPYSLDGVDYLVRDGAWVRKAHREELAQLIECTDLHFDDQPVDGACRSDLDSQAAARFVATAYRIAADTSTVEHYLHALRCMDASGVPTVAGLLCLGRDPQRWFPDARIEIVQATGPLDPTFVENPHVIAGKLSDQLEMAAATILHRVSTAWRSESTYRAIPVVVVREVLRNALGHRDYRVAAPVRVLLTADRLEVRSPGSLLDRMPLDAVRIGGIAVRRNPVLAALLARTGGRDQQCFGLPEMRRLLRDQALPEPELSIRDGHFTVVIKAWT